MSLFNFKRLCFSTQDAATSAAPTAGSVSGARSRRWSPSRPGVSYSHSSVTSLPSSYYSGSLFTGSNLTEASLGIDTALNNCYQENASDLVMCDRLSMSRPSIPAVGLATNTKAGAEKYASKAITKSKKMLSAREASALVPGYLEDAVRDSTKKSYRSYFVRYEKFCEESSLDIFNPEAVSLFLISLAESSQGKSAPLLAKIAIKYYLKLKRPFQKSPTDNYYIGRIVKSIRNKWSRPVKKAKCLGSTTLFKLVQNLLDKKDFKSDRAAIFYTIQFCICGRYEEVANLKPSDISFLPSGHIEVKVEGAKNYEKWDAQTSLIAQNPSGSFDPVENIKTYFNFISSKKSKWLFPNIRMLKGRRINLLDSNVSYDNMLKTLQLSLSEIGLDGKTFSLHSIRTGGLSEAANSGSVSNSDLQRHVRWKSSSMVDYYHQHSLDKRLSVSRSLKLYSM